MIHYTMEAGEEERKAAERLSIVGNPNKGKIRLMRLIMLVLAVLFLIYGLTRVGVGNGSSAVLPLGLCLFLVIYATAGMNEMTKNAVRARMSQNPEAFTGMRHYEIDETGIRAVTEEGGNVLAWDSFRSWGILEGYFCLITVDAQAGLIRRSGLREEESAGLEGYLKGIPQVRYK